MGPGDQPYRASVVRADPYEVEYDNGVRLPRDGFASQDADIFEGQQRVAPPMGGFGAGPMTADAGAGAAFNQAQQGLPEASDVTPTWGAGVAEMGDRIAAPPRLAPMEGSQGMGAPAGAPGAGDAGFRAPTPQDFARFGQGEAPPVAMPTPGAAYGSGSAPPMPPPMAGRVGGGAVTRSNTTTSTQRGVPLDPAIETDLNVQTARAQQALGDRAEAARGGAENLAGNRAFLEAQQLDLQRAAQAREAERAKTMQMADDEYRRAVTEFSAREVDPNRFYNSRGTGGTIIAALAMGLGALGQSLTGGENTAMQIIQSAIADDIEAQKANLQTAGKGLDARGNILAEMRARFGDERAAELAAEAALLRRAQTQAEGLEASARAAGALPEGDLQSAQLAMAADERLAELRERSADRVTTSVQTQRSSGGGGRGGGGAPQPRPPSATEMRMYSDRRGQQDAMRSVLGRIEEQIGAIPEGDDIPGVGLTRSLPDMLTSSDGRRLRADIGTLTAGYKRATTGVASSPAEDAAIRNTVEGLSDADLRMRIRGMRADIEAAASTLDAGFAPEVLEEFRARGGGERPAAGTAPPTFRRAGQ